MQKFFDDLLQCSSKKDAQRILKNSVLNLNEFISLIELFEGKGFTHESKQREHQPNSVKDVPGLIDTLVKNKASTSPEDMKKGRTAFNKLEAFFLERKIVTGHLFKKGSEWHLFFFSGNDYIGQHHSANHVHYSSHYWHDSSEYVWSELEKNTMKLKMNILR